MLTVMYIAIIVIFLLGMLVFGCSKVLCIIGMLLAGGSFAMRLLFSKRIPGKKLSIISAVGFAAVLIVSFMTGMNMTEGGLLRFDRQVAEIRSLIQKDKLEQAREEIMSLKKYYGDSDNVYILEAMAFIAESRYDDAIASLGNYSGKESAEYYSMMESVYLTEANPQQAENLRRLYFEAAKIYPEWTYMQKRAGMARLDSEEYAMAEYLLLRAYEQEPDDYETAYCLGTACYGQKRMEEALEFFDEAVRLGADDEMLGHIAWYAHEITK